MFSVTLQEARNIIGTLQKALDEDISGIAMASFRIRLSGIMQERGMNNAKELMDSLGSDPGFCEIFLRDISIGSPDLFRDPDLWICVRDELLPEILKTWMYPEILVPESVTGNELCSMAVLLREANLDYRIDLVATCRNEKIKEQIQEGELPDPRYKNSQDNYGVFRPDGNLEEYLGHRKGIPCLKNDLLQGTEIRIQSPLKEYCSDRTALVLYRNRMLYQDPISQYNTLRRILGQMPEGAYLITGIQESIHGFRLGHLYTTVSEDLKIYKRNHAD